MECVRITENGGENMDFISKEKEIGYTSQLKLIYDYLTEVSKQNYPIKKNAHFIMEVLKMREGIQKILYPSTQADIPEQGFIAMDKDTIAFNYVAETTGDPNLAHTSFVFIQPSCLAFYILTQHKSILTPETYYDFKYFGIDARKVLIFSEIEDDECFEDIFTLGKGIEPAIQKVKELGIQTL